MARLVFFGKLQDIAGGQFQHRALPECGCALSDIVAEIGVENRLLGEALRGRAIQFVVNEQIVDIDSNITDTDEIAFLPPVSGG